MSSEFDASEFVDNDFQAARKTVQAAHPPSASGLVQPSQRAPTREEVDSRVGEMQQKLSELKRVQEELERERAALEETRRKQIEVTTGRQEMIHHLTRGLGLLEEAEFVARREAEQMAKTLADLQEAMARVQSICEENWTKDTLNVELTRASTIIENARMEWNSARLKFSILSSEAARGSGPGPEPEIGLEHVLRTRGFLRLCQLGLALTWPVVLAALALGLALLRR